MILPRNRDPRYITLRRGGTLTDADHRLLARWAAACAEHVLPLFEAARPSDLRPRQAIEQARAWVRGEVRMTDARAAASPANAAARPLSGAPRYAAYAAAQAAAVAHVAAHDLGAAAYAVKAARAAAPKGDEEHARRLEGQWQRDQLPEAIRALVLDSQRLRNDICWSVFDGSEAVPTPRAASPSLTASPESDLPPGIGKPALRALAAAGYMRLDHLASVSDRDLLGLHGVGPKALAMLRRALDQTDAGGTPPNPETV